MLAGAVAELTCPKTQLSCILVGTVVHSGKPLKLLLGCSPDLALTIPTCGCAVADGPSSWIPVTHTGDLD